MAQSIQLTSGSLFCGNPIVATITPEYTPARATFHCIKLEVHAGRYQTDVDRDITIFTSPVLANRDIQIDISTALRAQFEKNSYAPLVADSLYRPVSYKLVVYDNYMVDGVLTTKVGERTLGDPNSLCAFPGGFTDMERMIAGTSKMVQRFSRKPATGEVCAQNEVLVHPTPFDAPKGMLEFIRQINIKAYSLTGKQGNFTAQGHTVFVVPPADNRYQFQFVNSLGVVESISCCCHPSHEVEKSHEENVITAPMAFGTINRHMKRSTTNRSIMKMSSGPVNRAWAEWWLHEFMESSQIWIKLASKWVPCNVIADDSVEYLDETSSALLQIPFTVKLNISGGWHNML